VVKKKKKEKKTGEEKADNTVDNNPQQCNSISASKPRPLRYASGTGHDVREYGSREHTKRWSAPEKIKRVMVNFL